MATFLSAAERLLEHEGSAYVQHPDDRGGPTKFGLSRRAYPQLDIAALAKEQALEIYRRDYWDARWERLPQILATKFLDLVVQFGRDGGVRLIQTALCDLGRQVEVDGRYGAQTHLAVTLVEPLALLRQLRARQAERYVEIVLATPSQRALLIGWLRRAVA